jgi:phosphatidylglycerol:prolipoprotein diacylglycerol transferase
MNLIHSLPNYIDPVLFKIGGFELRWYSLSYLFAFGVFAGLIFWRINKGENFFIQNKKKAKDEFLDIFLVAIAGLILGARLGYGLFYEIDLLIHPQKLFNPFQSGKFIGIYGMSFYGGLIGSFLGAYFFCYFKKINFWNWLNFSTPAIGLAYFFGRLGNFLNGELYGRETDLPWGMYFPKDPQYLLRHPSQLYEAFFEGLAIFLILWPLRNNKKMKNKLFGSFLIMYGIFRFLIEFFREERFYGIFTTGQYLSLTVIVAGIILVVRKIKHSDIV